MLTVSFCCKSLRDINCKVVYLDYNGARWHFVNLIHSKNILTHRLCCELLQQEAGIKHILRGKNESKEHFLFSVWMLSKIMGEEGLSPFLHPVIWEWIRCFGLIWEALLSILYTVSEGCTSTRLLFGCSACWWFSSREKMLTIWKCSRHVCGLFQVTWSACLEKEGLFFELWLL